MRLFSVCAGKDLNLRSPKATDLQSVVIDHSTTDAYCTYSAYTGTSLVYTIYTFFQLPRDIGITTGVLYMKTSPKTPLSYIELSASNLLHNIATIRAILAKDVKVVFAIKGNAYGHGQNEIVKIAEPHIDYFMVNSLEELRLLRAVSRRPTFLLGYVSEVHISEALSLGCILGVFSLEQFLRVQKYAKKAGIVQDVHIACDALLGREGFLEKELPAVLLLTKKSKNVCITGMYAHFANIEDTNNFTHAERQISAYARMREIASEYGYGNINTHISATSGVLAYESSNAVNPLVRIGIGAYGLWPSEHLEYQHRRKVRFEPVLSWKTHIAQVKTLPAGRTIGYGLTYMTQKATKIALIPQGYADGYPRALSNVGHVLIGGKKCPIRGRVSMNMFVVDVSKVSNVTEGDEVVLLGSQGRAHISAEELGVLAGSINYEVVTRISPLLPRVVQ